ncbi:MAG: PKD domain-containing protein, partial [Halobacteriota archaeon]|nr:PKD domain-containing protein [Halobacteriota archaeon]
EVTQSYIIDEGSFSPLPDSVTTDGSGLTTIVWNNIGNIGDSDPDMSSDETVTLSFTAKSNQNGAGLGVDVVPTAKVNYKDKDGNPAGSVEIPQAYINVNAPPVADANGPYEALEGTTITLDGSGSYDPDGDTLTYAWDLDDDGQYDDATGVTTTVDCPDDDSYTVGLEVSDGILKNNDTATVTVNNVAPTVTATGDTIDEDGTATVSGEITDPGALDTFTVVIDWGEGVPESFSYPAGTTSYSETHQYLDDNPTATPIDDYIVVVTITDDDGGVGSADTTVTVNNVAPEITSLTLPEDPVDISNPVDLNAEFTDIGIEDTHDATISWGDGNFDILSDVTSPIIESHTYALPGVYTITLTVMDDDIGSDSEVFMYVVVYDPNDGFVTGGGWINSPEGAYVPDPDLTGKATFGFVSKYKKGASEPTGNTEFQFHAAGLNFHSSSYDWLVIAGHKAKYKGTGTINGEGNYGFMISAIDEKLTPSTDVDKFRIKIWDKDNADTIVYDNQMGDADDSDATTEIQSGNIVIHKSKTQPQPPQLE